MYALTLFGVLSSGDSTENVRQIALCDLWSRSSHFSFHFFGIVFHLILRTLFGLDAVINTQVMLASMSVAGAVCFYLVVCDMFRSRQAALLAALTYGICSGVWRFSIQSEYLILVPSLMLISFRLAQTKHAVLSGLFLGLGGLTSPFVAMACPFYLYGFRFEKRKLFFLGTIVMISMIVYFGISTVSSSGAGGEARWTLGEALYRFFKTVRWGRGGAVFIYGMVRAFHVLLPAAIYGFYLLYKRDRMFLLLAMLSFILHLPTTLSEARQGAYFLGFYPAMAVAAATALIHLKERYRHLPHVLTVTYCLVSAMIVIPEMLHFRAVRADYRKMDEDRAIPDGSVVLVYPSQKPFNYYVRRLQGESVESYVASAFADGKDPGWLQDNDRHLYLVESGIRVPDDGVKRFLSGGKNRLGTRTAWFGKSVVTGMFPQAQFEVLPGYHKTIYRICL